MSQTQCSACPPRDKCPTCARIDQRYELRAQRRKAKEAKHG